MTPRWPSTETVETLVETSLELRLKSLQPGLLVRSALCDSSVTEARDLRDGLFATRTRAANEPAPFSRLRRAPPRPCRLHRRHYIGPARSAGRCRRARRAARGRAGRASPFPPTPRTPLPTRGRSS